MFFLQVELEEGLVPGLSKRGLLCTHWCMQHNVYDMCGKNPSICISEAMGNRYIRQSWFI